MKNLRLNKKDKPARYHIVYKKNKNTDGNESIDLFKQYRKNTLV